MFDARLRPLLDPPLNALALWLAKRGVGANQLTLIGLVVGVCGAVAISQGWFGWGLGLIVANRVLDGLDGAVARVNGPTDLGGYYDVVADFIFYVSVPLGFGLVTPENLLPALLLVASFVLTGASFLAFAVVAAKRGADTRAHGRKGFFYSTGLAEGGETILAFVAMCVFPGSFGWIACGFALLCVATLFQRTVMAVRMFR